MSRHASSTIAGCASAEAAITAAVIHRTTDCLNDKLAHRALGGIGRRPGMPALSAEAQDRFYERMFPSHICMGTKVGGTSDPLP